MSETANRRRLEFRELGLVLAILGVIGIIAARGKWSTFSSYEGNLARMLLQIGMLGVFAVGEAVVIIGGGIDLSVGSVIGISGMLAAMILSKIAAGGATLATTHVLGVTALMVMLGVAIGGFHALLVTRLRLPPFIATLSTLAGLRSAAQLVTSSKPVPVAADCFRALGKGSVPLVVFVVLAVAMAVLMTRSRLGRSILAVGGNEEAARLSGIATGRVKALTYCISGALAALAGVLYAAFIGQGVPSTGNAYELRAIAACVVGGCSLNGGIGTVLGTCLGAVLMEVTLNGIGLVVSENSSLWQGVVIGVVVIFAASLNSLRQSRGRGADKH